MCNLQHHKGKSRNEIWPIPTCQRPWMKEKTGVGTMKNEAKRTGISYDADPALEV